MRILVAMSGGVDSSVAAARAVEAGHEVVGVHLALHKDAQQTREKARGCCSLEDSADARRICDKLGIPFYVWDFSEEFKEAVITDFVDSYARGETPNPCLRCNEKIKFAALLRKGMALGFDAVATGHYATLDKDGYMRRSLDENKDQSYVLGVITAEELNYCYFPIGDTPKPLIREEAKRHGFSTASKPDSYDICFIPDGNTQAFLGAHRHATGHDCGPGRYWLRETMVRGTTPPASARAWTLRHRLPMAPTLCHRYRCPNWHRTVGSRGPRHGNCRPLEVSAPAMDGEFECDVRYVRTGPSWHAMRR